MRLSRSFWLTMSLRFLLCLLILLIELSACIQLIPPNQKQFQLPEDEGELFRNFLMQNDRHYSSKLEYSARFKTFRENRKKVERLNQIMPEAIFALNQFGDMTTEEFKTQVLMPHGKYDQDAHRSHLHQTKRQIPDIPDTFDWREYGAVTDVKDQGLIGSCWAFSTVANIEGQYYLKTKQLVSMSEEQLVECDNLDCGEFGGWPHTAYEYIKRAGGLISSTTLPYCSGLPLGTPGSCDPCMARGYNTTICGNHDDLYCNKTYKSCSLVLKKNIVTSLVNWVAISQNETDIQLELVQRGPLSVLLDADSLQFYKSGVFNPPDFMCDPTSLDHAVLLVGYGINKGILHDTPYWLVKNSWGPKWGENGYFRIYRGDGKCGINTAVTSAILLNDQLSPGF